jgi:LemA protein
MKNKIIGMQLVKLTRIDLTIVMSIAAFIISGNFPYDTSDIGNLQMQPRRFTSIIITFLITFVIIAIVSFMSLRPILNETRYDARAELDSFMRSVKDRNDFLPALLEIIKTFEPGQSKLVTSLLETRAICMRSNDPNAISPLVIEIDRYLVQLEKILKNNSKLEANQTFAAQWRIISKLSARIYNSRRNYNNIARIYNKMLKPFPQNLIIFILGYNQLHLYQETQGIGDQQ